MFSTVVGGCPEKFKELANLHCDYAKHGRQGIPQEYSDDSDGDVVEIQRPVPRAPPSAPRPPRHPAPRAHPVPPRTVHEPGLHTAPWLQQMEGHDREYWAKFSPANMAKIDKKRQARANRRKRNQAGKAAPPPVVSSESESEAVGSEESYVNIHPL